MYGYSCCMHASNISIVNDVCIINQYMQQINLAQTYQTLFIQFSKRQPNQCLLTVGPV